MKKYDSSNTYVAIMAGGVGSRFWPASRSSKPKQFLDILGVGKSLLQLTYERFLKLCPKEHILIVTHAMYKDLVLEHLPELSENQVLCEPSRNNTAPSVAYAAFKLEQMNPGANFVVAPSDHIILDENSFTEVLKQALMYTSEHDALLTLGIQPTRPDTGYGYINFDKNGQEGIHKVLKFTEKPHLEKAKEFLESGDYLWNAGIFIWRVSSILNAFKQLAPEVYEILGAGRGSYHTPQEDAFIQQHYPSTPNISIDYAILEKAENVFTIPSEFGWSDLGTWASLHAEADKDNDNNALHGDMIMLYDSSNNLVRVPKGKLVVLKDLHDYIVVDEEDVLLIYPKSKEQEIKQITREIEARDAGSFL